MRKKFKYLFAFLFIGNLSLAQEKDSVKVADVLQNKMQNLNIITHQPYSMNDKVPKIIYHDENKTEYPDVFLNENPASFETIRAINPKNIEHIEIEKTNDIHSGKDRKKSLLRLKLK